MMKPIDYYVANDNTLERNFLFEREQKSKAIITEALLKKSTKNISFLDIGCGDGYFLYCLSKELGKKCEFHGVDYSEFQLERAKKKLNEAIFKRVNLEDGIPYDDNCFDVIYAGELIEHLYNPDSFIREAYRILKNNGTCVISTPNINSWLSRLVFPLGVYPIFYETSTEDSRFGFGFLKTIKKQRLPVGHIRVMNVDAINSLLITNHFQVVDIQGVIFERYTGVLGFLDKLFSFRPTLSSGLVVCATKES